MSVLAKINSKMKDNFLSLHPIWHFASRMQFSFILPVRNVCVDKMDYWFRECAVTGVTAVTIWVGVTNLLAGNMVCIKCLETSQLVNLHHWKYEGFGVWLQCLFLLRECRINLNTTVFRVNITHTFKAIRKSLEVPAFCRKYPSPWKSAVFRLEYFVSDQKWISCTTLAHLVAEKMRNSEKDA